MNRTEQIYQELKKRLLDGLYSPGSRFPSEAMLADEFSVNKMTMNKIVSMLAEQHYLVRGVRGAGTRVTDSNLRFRGGLAFLSQISPYSSRILQGITDEATRNDYMTLIEAPPIEALNYRLQLLRNQGIRGVISLGYGIPSPPPDMHICCVDCTFIPTNVNNSRIHFINSDNYQGGVQMMEAIISRGHRNILIFSSERYVASPNATIPPRIRAFHDIMKKYQLTDFAERTFYSAPASRQDARHFLQQYLKQYPDTTLICTDSDNSAELIHFAALELGISCPGDIALTGFGNVTGLPIASINQNPRRQGELAVRSLIAGTKGSAAPSSECEMVETELTGMENIPDLRH